MGDAARILPPSMYACRKSFTSSTHQVTRAYKEDGDTLSYSRKFRLASRLLHRHVLKDVGQSAWMICSGHTRGLLLTAASLIIEARAPRTNIQCLQHIVVFRTRHCQVSTELGL